MKYLNDLLRQYETSDPDELARILATKRGDTQTLAELERLRAMQEAAKKYEPEPAAAYVCKTCHGLGWLSSGATEPTEPLFGKLIPCTNPRCDRQSEYKRNRAATLMSRYDDMPAEYRELSFDTFYSLHPKQRKGKELAAAAARYLATNPKRGFKLSDVLMTISGIGNVDIIEPDYDSDYERDYTERVKFVDLDAETPETVILPNSYGSSLVLASPSKGIGKTGLAVAAYNQLIADGVACAFVHFPTLLDRVRRTYNQTYSGDSLDDILLPVRDAEVLILDEFGVVEGKRASEHTIKIVQDNIITPRFNAHHSKPIIATTNHNQKSFVAQFDELAASRVFKMAHWLNVGGITLRRFNPGIS